MKMANKESSDLLVIVTMVTIVTLLGLFGNNNLGVNLASAQTYEGRAQSIDVVHVIFMNHLDVGYDQWSGTPKTGFVNNVLYFYFNEYFPRAVNLSAELRNGSYVEQFIYTTHPWLVSLYLDCPQNLTLSNVTLKCPQPDQVARFKKAIARGDITWHAGPMNMQLENMNQLLFELSLNISFSLDARFGIARKYRTLSQRDVPGMTQAIIPSLERRGISAVSVGVNPSSSPPVVPKLFVWRYETSEVLAMWHAGGYPLNPGPSPAKPGGMSRNDCVIVENIGEALCFAFRGDNGGPPKNIQEILNNYEILRKEFPGAKLKASTFENFVQAVQPIKKYLPVVSMEIGDTWIQGISSDPLKLAEYRTFSDAVSDCFDAGKCSYSDPRIADMVRFLIKPGEHTYGLNTVNDTVNWSNPMFEHARSGSNYVNCTSAWLEQRQFLGLAFTSLKDHRLSEDIKRRLQYLAPKLPDLSGFTRVQDTSLLFTCGDGLQISFTLAGGIRKLWDPYNKVTWTDSEGNAFAQFVYTTYNETDFKIMGEQYNYYGGAGFTKTNSTKYAHPESRQWPTKLKSLYKGSAGRCRFILKLVMVDKKTESWYGAPKSVWIEYSVRQPTKLLPGGLDVTVQWFKKTSTRLPEALMFYFHPQPSQSIQNNRWMISKLGRLVDPGNVVMNGSQYLHAVDRNGGVYFIDNHGNGLQLVTLDVPVVAIGSKAKAIPSPFPIPLTPVQSPSIETVAFNFYNNIWDTNYIFWYPFLSGDENFKARFKINFCVKGRNCNL